MNVARNTVPPFALIPMPHSSVATRRASLLRMFQPLKRLAKFSRDYVTPGDAHLLRMFQPLKRLAKFSRDYVTPPATRISLRMSQPLNGWLNSAVTTSRPAMHISLRMSQPLKRLAKFSRDYVTPRDAHLFAYVPTVETAG
jgi:hypothetical protein